ncbi:MAG: hypothetical protein ACK55I_24150, partial [bacterium]
GSHRARSSDGSPRRRRWPQRSRPPRRRADRPPKWSHAGQRARRPRLGDRQRAAHRQRRGRSDWSPARSARSAARTNLRRLR